MVSLERLKKFRRGAATQKKLPLPERRRIIAAREVMEVLDLEAEELRGYKRRGGAYPEAAAFARTLGKVRRNLADARAGETFAPFAGCATKPAFSTLAREVACTIAFGMWDVLDDKKEQDMHFLNAVEAFCEALEAWATAFSNRGKGNARKTIATLLKRYEKTRTALHTLMQPPGPAEGLPTICAPLDHLNQCFSLISRAC